MKQVFTLLLMVCTCFVAKSQSVYTASNYAKIGDTIYLTSAMLDTFDFSLTGPGKVWNYVTLNGISQQQLIFRNPKSTGFTQLQWPYIYNAGNVNISSTNNQSIAVGPLEESDNNDYYLNNTGALALKASSFRVSYNNVSINIKNIYSQADTLYKFPLNYTDSFKSNAAYVTSIPSVYYNQQITTRANKVDGWGTVVTPFGSFTHCLRVTSAVVQTDTFSFYGTGMPAITTQYREFKWLDTSRGYPVLYVKQMKTTAGYVTSLIQYMDKQQYFQPQALFAYVPLLPVKNDTVTFQNLSINSTAWHWDFGDGTISSIINPQHIFTSAGKYPVTLIAYNGPKSDTAVLSIMVGDASLPVKLVSFTGMRGKDANLLQWSTSTEINTDHFTLERSDAGNNFIAIATMPAAGNSSQLLQYSFLDNTASAVTYYYRLKMVDKDGKAVFSNTIKLGATLSNIKTALAPNPVKKGNQVTLFIQVNNATEAILTVYSAEGKAVIKKAVKLSAGSNSIVIPAGALSAGIYFVDCINTNKLVVIP